MTLNVAELDTPALVVDLDVFDRNVDDLMQRLTHVAVRPHLKTAKSPPVARLLLDAGARGICVAKLSEAEVMADAGIEDILVTTEIVGPEKIRRLTALVARARVRVVLDSIEGARALDAGLPEPVEALIDVNVGHDRTGVGPEQAAPLADAVAELDRLRVVGVQGYEGNLQHVRDASERRGRCDRAMDRLRDAVDAMRAAGHTVDIVTTGGTGTAEFCAAHDFVTEVQPGSFAFMDTDYGDTGGVPYAHALSAIATVISHADPDRAVVDAGLKALSNDSGSARLADAPGWAYRPGGDEHGILTPTGGERRSLAIGDRVSLTPSHIDTTINLHDVMHAHRGGSVEATWPIAARGRIQ
jgi:D-serine deaminase-like pyridoxal phosphate-dependent protein